jgi:nicotinamide-nucleotide amidase
MTFTAVSSRWHSRWPRRSPCTPSSSTSIDTGPCSLKSDLEILTIGTELLLGFTVDTNSAEIAQLLAPAGLRVTRRTAIGDDPEQIRSSLKEALQRTGTVITTGGLGPTRDDITKKAVADLFGLPLEFQENIWQELLVRFARYGRKLAESNRCQAEVPRSAVVLPNQRGTAPGLWIEVPEGLVIMLPGVPIEMRLLTSREVLPRLRNRAGGSVILSRTIRTSGIAESSLAELLGNIEPEIAPLTLAYLPGFEGVDLRVTAWNLPENDAGPLLESAASRIQNRAGKYIYGEGTTDLAALVLDAARKRGERIAVAESCTGGLLGGRLTAIPGSTEVFEGGVIAYDDRVKSHHLGVDPGLIEAHGAVSEPVCAAMAQGVAARFNTGLAMAITGIAGPDGGSPAKPVGLVWFASLANGTVTSQSFVFPGNREEIRARAAQATLFQLYGTIRT